MLFSDLSNLGEPLLLLLVAVVVVVVVVVVEARLARSALTSLPLLAWSQSGTDRTSCMVWLSVFGPPSLKACCFPVA